jgi:hypothetical protein
MRIYKGLEITKVAGLMDSIMMRTSLVELFGKEDVEGHFQELALAFPETFDEETICFIADDEQSFLLAYLDDDACRIRVAMWAAVDDKLGFKQTMQYFRELKRIYIDVARNVQIEADCRVTTSLPIINKLDGRKGVHVVYRGKEDHGFVPVAMICRIDD